MDRKELIGFLISACEGDHPEYEVSRALVSSGVLLGDPISEPVHHALADFIFRQLPVTLAALASAASSGIGLADLDVAHRIVEYLWDIDHGPRHRSAWRTYLAAVQEMDSKNKVIESLELAAEAVRSGKMAPSEVSVVGTPDGMGEDPDVVSGDFYGSLRTRLDCFWAGGPSQFVPTAWPSLSRRIGGGWRRAALNFVVARPGCGKSALAEQDAEFQDSVGVRSAYCAIEMDAEDHLVRIIQRRHHDLLKAHGCLDFEGLRVPAQKQRVVLDAAREASSLKFRFLSCTTTSAQKIMLGLEREWAKSRFDVAYMDYFQLLSFDGVSDHPAATLEGLKRVLSRLVLPWARKRNVAVVLLAQAKRELDDPSWTPKKSDISDCSEAEKLASNVVFIHSGKFVVAKARRGVPGSIDVEFDGPRLTFRESRLEQYVI